MRLEVNLIVKNRKALVSKDCARYIGTQLHPDWHVAGNMVSHPLYQKRGGDTTEKKKLGQLPRFTDIASAQQAGKQVRKARKVSKAENDRRHAERSLEPEHTEIAQKRINYERGTTTKCDSIACSDVIGYAVLRPLQQNGRCGTTENRIIESCCQRNCFTNIASATAWQELTKEKAILPMLR